MPGTDRRPDAWIVAERTTIDGNEAAAWGAYRASEVIAVYPP